MKIDYTNSINFKANIIAQSGNFKICQLTDSNDIKFLKDFSQRTNFKKLMPNIPKNECERWHEMLDYAIECAEDAENTTYLEILNNKLCGIITCFENKTAILDCICTIPINAGKKVKLAGKTLFYQVFKDFCEYGGKRMKLSAITNGPYNTIDKYKELGFQETTNITETTVEMDINRYTLKKSLKMLEKIIPYKPLPNEKFNLSNVIIN